MEQPRIVSEALIGRISPPSADARPTNISGVKETRLIDSKFRGKTRKQKVIRQLPNKMKDGLSRPRSCGPTRQEYSDSRRWPSAASGGRDSAFLTNLSLKRRKFLPTDAIRADGVLEILGFRGWENAARVLQQGTAWAPAPESLGFLALRPAEGEEIFSYQRDLPKRRLEANA